MYWMKKYCTYIWISVIPKHHICSKLSLVTVYIPLKADALRGTACTCVSIWLFARGVLGSTKGISFLKADTVSTFSLSLCFFDATFLVTGVDSLSPVSSGWASGLECYKRYKKRKKPSFAVFWSHSGTLQTRKFWSRVKIVSLSTEQ